MSRKRHTIVGGVQVDVVEGWKKVAVAQMNAGRALAEAVQNALDGYPEDVPMPDRVAEVRTRDDTMIVIDYGTGLSLEKVALLCSLGGSDKRGSAAVGRFGLGFFVIFSEELGTRRVSLTSRVDGTWVEVTFEVVDRRRPPEISWREVEAPPRPFGVRLEAQFGSREAVLRCLRESASRLRHYDARIRIDGQPIQSTWARARALGRPIFEDAGCRGFFGVDPGVMVLNRYEHILTTTLEGLATGGHQIRHDLRDLRRRAFPFGVSGGLVINSNDLDVCLSRDQVRLDSAYYRMCDVVRRQLARRLLGQLDRKERSLDALTLPNLYTLGDRVSKLLRGQVTPDGGPLDTLCQRLIQHPVFRVSGERRRASLAQLHARRTDGLPVFWTPTGRPASSFVGGAFRHDFLLIMARKPTTLRRGGAPDFEARILKDAFGDVIDLDTVTDDPKRLASLVKSGVVDPALLTPTIALGRAPASDPALRTLLEELNTLMGRPDVREVVRGHLNLPVRRLRVAWFTAPRVRGAVGIFDTKGRPFCQRPDRRRDVVIGLRADHALIRRLATSRHPYRALFSLCLLAGRIASSHAALIPWSGHFAVVRSGLERALRNCFMADLAADRDA